MIWKRKLKFNTNIEILRKKIFVEATETVDINSTNLLNELTKRTRFKFRQANITIGNGCNQSEAAEDIPH